MSKFSSTDSGATVLSKLNNTIITVGTQTGADYVCDGTADDVQIQAAIDAVGAAGGGKIIIRHGTYDISAGITFPDNIVLEGEGITTVLNFSYAGESMMFTNEDDDTGNTFIEIRNLKLVCDSSLQTNTNQSSAIGFYGVTNFIIDNCYINDTKSDGIDLRDTTDASINCSGIISNNHIETIGRNGISVEGGDNIKIYGNTIRDVAFLGIDLEGGDLNRDIIISENNISDFKAGGIQVYPISSPDAYSNIVISSNNVRDSKTTSASPHNVRGIRAYYNTDTTIKNLVISNNNIYNIKVDEADLTGIGIEVTGRSNGVCGALVECNTIVDVKSYGIYAGCERQIIKGNHIEDAGVLGINVDQQYSIINGNYVYSCDGAGINLYNADDSVIIGNIVDSNTTYGIRVWTGSSNVVVESNRVLGATQTTGIEIDLNSGGCLVQGNIITDATTSILNSSATSKVRNNLGWVTEASGTGTIANGATTATITHGLSVTPTLDDISITLGENPTNTPGAIFVTALGATTFVVNCENDPGSSGLDFSWRAVVL
jgi:parallel beta-helix repeat protein